MARNGTGLLENLSLVYASYGGWSSFFRSGYTWAALAFTALSWRTAHEGEWPELTLSLVPTLAGISVASYALFFAILSESDRRALRAPEPSLNNRSPLLILASAVAHAVFIQIAAIILAIIFEAKPFPYVKMYKIHGIVVNAALSYIGMFLTIYGIVLALAAVLSVFRITQIQTKT